MKSNGLIKWLVLPVLILLLIVVVRSCSSDKPSNSADGSAVGQLSPEELKRLPESVFPQALTPGVREIGTRAAANLWGNVYPRSGFLHQPNDLKAAAVMAQRAGDVVTRSGQVHVYQPLIAQPQPGYWPAGELRETEIRTGKWQQLAPVVSQTCGVFPDQSPAVQSQDGGYAWALWRPYSCCKREGQTFLGSTGEY